MDPQVPNNQNPQFVAGRPGANGYVRRPIFTAAARPNYFSSPQSAQPVSNPMPQPRQFMAPVPLTAAPPAAPAPQPAPAQIKDPSYPSLEEVSITDAYTLNRPVTFEPKAPQPIAVPPFTPVTNLPQLEVTKQPRIRRSLPIKRLAFGGGGAVVVVAVLLIMGSVSSAIKINQATHPAQVVSDHFVGDLVQNQSTDSQQFTTASFQKAFGSNVLQQVFKTASPAFKSGVKVVYKNVVSTKTGKQAVCIYESKTDGKVTYLKVILKQTTTGWQVDNFSSYASLPNQSAKL